MEVDGPGILILRIQKMNLVRTDNRRNQRLKEAGVIGSADESGELPEKVRIQLTGPGGVPPDLRNIGYVLIGQHPSRTAANLLPNFLLYL